MVSENNKCHNLCFEQFPKCVLDILISKNVCIYGKALTLVQYNAVHTISLCKNISRSAGENNKCPKGFWPHLSSHITLPAQ